MASTKQWADYLISAVRYDEDRNHIEKARVHEDNGDTVGAASEWTRSSVVKAIDKGQTFCTILKTSDGKWKKGQDVHIVVLEGKRFIRTDANQVQRDNLGSLPEF